MTRPQDMELGASLARRPAAEPPAAAPSTPLRFSLTSFIKPSRYSEEAYLSCEACKEVAEELSERLFEEQAVLKAALEAGMCVRFGGLKLHCYDVMGRFDHAVCHLRLNKPAPSLFLVHTYFYAGTRLVATAVRPGALAR